MRSQRNESLYGREDNNLLVNALSDAVIVGYGETPISRGKIDRGEERLLSYDYYQWALELCLEHAGLEHKDVKGQGLAVGGTVSNHSEFWSVDIAEFLGITPRYLIRSDHGGASGLSMLRDAALAVSSGIVDYCVCLGADAPQTNFSANFPNSDYTRDFENPAGVQGPNDMFALIMRRHMYQYGTKLEHTGKIAICQRENALRNPMAYFKKPITLNDYLDSKLIADPLRLLDCVMAVNGGLGLIVSSKEKSKQVLKNSGRRGVSILGFGECDAHFHGSRSIPDITYTGMGEASARAFGMANKSTADMDFLQPYDDYTICVLMQIEDMGFCNKGTGGKFIEEHDLSWKGDFPVNTGGGQISAGQPGLAGGFVNIVEGIRQLMGEGGERQVKDAKIGCITGFGGRPNPRCTMNNMVAILANAEGL